VPAVLAGVRTTFWLLPGNFEVMRIFLKNSLKKYFNCFKGFQESDSRFLLFFYSR